MILNVVFYYDLNVLCSVVKFTTTGVIQSVAGAADNVDAIICNNVLSSNAIWRAFFYQTKVK